MSDLKTWPIWVHLLDAVMTFAVCSVVVVTLSAVTKGVLHYDI